MTIQAHVQNEQGRHRATVRTGDVSHALSLAPKPDGLGSGTSGGELLFLALATCACNDVYREAARLGLDVQRVDVEVGGTFGGVGEPATDIGYRVQVTASGASEDAVRALIEQTDRVAEVHNTLRVGTAVRLRAADVVLVP